MAKGLLIVISGPSGVGKGTVLKEVVKDPELNIGYSISMTTREKRPGEENGVNYYFVTRDEFHKAVEDGELLEWTVFVGNCYGTPIKEVERLRNEGKNVLLEIEQDGCSQVRKKVPDTLSIFIIPPSMEELERRIRSRKTEPEEIVQQRLAKAAKDMNNLKEYNYVVCNEDVKLAAEISQASDFIEEKEHGYDSAVAQGGGNVSGGQKQRLAIARAIARKPKILIFDDSFSALDFKTDVAVRKALGEHVNDSTVFIVAQRVSTILSADQILLLDECTIVGKGTHKELMQTCEEYRQIAESQLSPSEIAASLGTDSDRQV